MPKRNLNRCFVSFLFVCTYLSSLQYADEHAAKKALQIEDYGRWRSISSTAIGPLGRWASYAYRTPEKDDILYLKNLTNDKSHKIDRGKSAVFSDDGKWAAYIVQTAVKEAEKLKKQKKAVPQQVELLNLDSGKKITVQRGERFTFSKGSSFLAVKKTKRDKQAKHRETDLILINLSNQKILALGNVNLFAFNKPGKLLAYTIDAAESNGNGIYLFNTDNWVVSPLDTGAYEYGRLTWDEAGLALAVLRGKKKEGNKYRDNSLLAFSSLPGTKRSSHHFEPVAEGASALKNYPGDMVISENGALSWDLNRKMVFFGIRPQEKEVKKEKDADPVANVDVWHWNDDAIQSVQMRRAQRDRNYTYRAVIHLQKGRFVRLTDDTMKSIRITRNGRWGIGEDYRPYVSDWKERQTDIYRVDTSNGERKLIVKGQKRTLGLSPDSRHFLMWREGNIWDYQLESGKLVNLSGTGPLRFSNEEFDHPGTKPPYGLVGWTKDGRGIILNHRYDLYLQPFSGRPATNLTSGYGDKNEIRFRYIQFDREKKYIDLSKPIVLSALGQWTKEAGFYSLFNGKLKKGVYGKHRYGRPVKAKRADRYLYTRESYDAFPDYYVSGPGFANAERITEANPWQSEYLWGHNILIEYKNSEGKRLQGVLSIPDNYRNGQKLPLLVDFYEKNSQNLYRYSRLVYRDTPMFYKYVSNGYLVLLPDVHFNTRTTHSDMLDCVEAAVRRVIELGYADPKRVGLHGHSFSGQGSALIAGRSKMFAAIVAGAAATNLVSDFNQLWKSAGTNQHRYDYYGQGRFGTNPFDDLKLYLDESGTFHARTMNTPLLLLHGTDDGSVEWLQAIEFYNALRFNGKNVILCSYPGAGHHLRKLENQKDFQLRMEQFYDHYLRGKAAPEWMVKGIPFIKKKK